jgi:hypothetical protein
MSGLRTTNIFSFLFHAQRSLSKNISHQIILSSSILDRTTTTTRHKKPLRARQTLERRAAARSTVWNEKVAKKKNFKIATDVYDAVTVTCHPRHTRTIRLSVHHSLLSLSSLSLSLRLSIRYLLQWQFCVCPNKWRVLFFRFFWFTGKSIFRHRDSLKSRFVLPDFNYLLNT